MMGFVSEIRHRARDTARAVAFTVIGVIFGLTGLAFLTVALWILIATYDTALMAHAVIGGLYLVLGVIFLVVGGGQKSAAPRADYTERPPPAPQKDPILQVAEAFAVGLQAGRSARKP